MDRNVVIVLGIIFLVGAWFLAAPLFIDATVDESADFLAADGQIDLEAVLEMPDEKQLAMRSVIMDAAASAPDRKMSEAMPASIDISGYHSVVIWCELIGVLFSPAALTVIDKVTSD